MLPQKREKKPALSAGNRRQERAESQPYRNSHPGTPSLILHSPCIEGLGDSQRHLPGRNPGGRGGGGCSAQGPDSWGPALAAPEGPARRPEPWVGTWEEQEVKEAEGSGGSYWCCLPWGHPVGPLTGEGPVFPHLFPLALPFGEKAPNTCLTPCPGLPLPDPSTKRPARVADSPAPVVPGLASLPPPGSSPTSAQHSSPPASAGLVFLVQKPQLKGSFLRGCFLCSPCSLPPRLFSL